MLQGIFRDFKMFFIIVVSFHFLYGQNWERINNADTTDIYSITGGNGLLFACSYENIFKSEDGGRNWTATGTKPSVASGFNTLFWNNGIIFAGTSGNGVFYSNDSGKTWIELNQGLSGGAKHISSFSASGDSLFAGSDGNGIFMVNLKNMSDWQVFNNGLFQYGVNKMYTAGDYLFSSAGLYLFERHRSDDKWQDVYVDSIQLQRSVWSMFHQSEYIFAGTDNGIYRKIYGSSGWERCDIFAFQSKDIAAITGDGSRIFAAADYLDQFWIFSSDNYGNSWDFRSHEYAFLYDLYFTGGTLFAGRTDGLWYLDVSNWTGIENPVKEPAHNFELEQNYPNPFNPSTIIRYQLPVNSRVNLTIYNLLGQEISTPVNELQAAGNFEVRFDASGLAGGIYLYTLQTGEGNRITKKMVLLK